MEKDAWKVIAAVAIIIAVGEAAIIGGLYMLGVAAIEAEEGCMKDCRLEGGSSFYLEGDTCICSDGYTEWIPSGDA